MKQVRRKGVTEGWMKVWTRGNLKWMTGWSEDMCVYVRKVGNK